MTLKGKLKYILAAIGAVYAVLFVGWAVYAVVNRPGAAGPSELELHPERAGEIRAQERVAEMRERLNLSDEQTQKIQAILEEFRPGEGGDPRERFRAMRDAVSEVLTPEQREQEEQMRPRGPGGPGGPGGRRGGPPFMNPERMEEVKNAMTPEQRERFEKRMELMRERRPFGRGRGPGGGLGGGPDGPPPDGPPPDGAGEPPPPPQ